MPNTISIGITQPEAAIKINADPVLASNVTPRLTPGASFTPAPNQFAEFNVETSPYTTVTSPYEEAAIGGISFQQPVNINVGETVSSLVPDLLTAYVYKFDNFTMPGGHGFSKGDIVKKGESLLFIESMKMEIPIEAPFDSEIEEIFIKKDEVISQNQPLLTLKS